uniref:Macin n=1 Tax=Mytilus galloprovincialis TaxID=29158 RepID=G4U4K7_MYTGA|nr:macin [Mytilus galloprovincialis]CCC15018.1 mytimacin-4 [Mytilus galloprovincialis]
MGYLGLCGILLGLSLLTLLHIPTSEANVIGDCWDDWSRCTRQTDWFTNIFWQSCQNRCKCKGQPGGNCIEVPSKCFLWKDKRWMCDCYGPTSGSKPWWCGF